MWHYLWVHTIYHCMKIVPRHNRIQLRVLLMILSSCLLIPQFYIIFLSKSSRVCDAKLHDFLIATVVLTYITIGFSLLLSLMDPVPKQIIISFHVFGGLSFIFSLVYTVITLSSQTCNTVTPELYQFSLCLAIVSIVSMGFVLIMSPCWIINSVRSGSVFNPKEGTGTCYEPIRCCFFCWHVEDEASSPYIPLHRTGGDDDNH